MSCTIPPTWAEYVFESAVFGAGDEEDVAVFEVDCGGVGAEASDPEDSGGGAYGLVLDMAEAAAEGVVTEDADGDGFFGLDVRGPLGKEKDVVDAFGLSAVFVGGIGLGAPGGGERRKQGEQDGEAEDGCAVEEGGDM